MSIIRIEHNLQYAKDLYANHHGQSANLDVKYLPERRQKNRSAIDELASLRLIYLAMIKAGGERLPCTKKQFEVFKKSDRANCLTVYGLRTGVVIQSLLLVVLGCFPLIPANQSEDQSPNWTVVALMIAGIVVNIFMGALSYWATGFAPNTSSNRFNDKQDTIIELDETYESLAYQLIDLYYNEEESFRAFAQAVASEIEIEAIKEKLQKILHSKDKAAHMVKILEQVLLFITHENRVGEVTHQQNSDGESEELELYTEDHAWPEDPLLKIVIETKMTSFMSRKKT